jgi:hypothetical protein
MRIENKSAASLKASVGIPPCEQCTVCMQDFCAKKRPDCEAWKHYVETGATPQRSVDGWVV